MGYISKFIHSEHWLGYVALAGLALGMVSSAFGAAATQSLELTRGKGYGSTSAWTPATEDSLATYLQQHTGKTKATKPSIDGSSLQTWVESKSGKVVWAFACEYGGNRRVVQVEHSIRAFSGKQGDDQTIYAYVRSQCSGSAAAAVTPATDSSPLQTGANDIAEVLYAWRITYAGTLMQFKETVYVLFTNGTGIKNPVPALSEIHATKHQAEHPKHWFRWRKAHGEYQLQPLQGGKWDKIKSDGPLKTVHPVASGTRYAGKLEGVTSAGSLGGTHSANWRRFTFSPDGRYERSTSSLRGSDTMLNDAASGTYASTCDKDGSRSAGTTNTGGVVVGSRASKSKCGTALTGRYEIDGYRIILKGDDGRTDRLSFFEIRNAPHKSEPKKRKYSLMIGGAGYGTRER